MKENELQVISFGKIQTSIINRKYRHVKLKDLNNGKSIDYVIFEDREEPIWEGINKYNSETKLPPVFSVGTP